MLAASTARIRSSVPPTTPPCVFLAIDWSGAKHDERRRMWLAEARDGRIARLERGRDRAEIVQHVIDCAAREPRLVVGIDFAFSFPRWFLDERALDCARGLWEHVAVRGEEWLAYCPHPFWGKPGIARPAPSDARPAWRQTENETTRVRGIAPKSVFQIGGAGSVGTGSLRGMPYLARLRAAGFSIWPFDPPRLPLVVEIYPRELTGAVNKSSPVARALYVQAHLPRETRAIQDLASSTEDAFDAAISAACMQRFAHDFARLDRTRTDLDPLEGRIWRPLRDPLFDRLG